MEHNEKRPQRRERRRRGRRRSFTFSGVAHITMIHRIHTCTNTFTSNARFRTHTHKHLRSRNFLLRIMHSRYSDCFMPLCKNGVTCYLAFIRHFGCELRRLSRHSPPSPLRCRRHNSAEGQWNRAMCARFQVKRIHDARSHSAFSTAVVCIVSSTSSTKSFLRHCTLFGSARRQWLGKIFGLVYIWFQQPAKYKRLHRKRISLRMQIRPRQSFTYQCIDTIVTAATQILNTYIEIHVFIHFRFAFSWACVR